EMKKIVLDYTKPAVKEFYSKIIYPFRFNAKNLKKIIKHFSTSDLFSQKQFQENYQLVHYFQPYIQEYLFNVRGKRNGYSYHFENKDQYSLRLKVGENKITTCNQLPENDAELIDTAEISIGNPSIVLFRYGVVFFIIDVSNTENQKI